MQAFYACGLLRLMPSQRCVEGLLRMGLTQRLQEWQGSDLACVMWSLATLRYPVTSDTLDAVITQVSAVRDGWLQHTTPRNFPEYYQSIVFSVCCLRLLCSCYSCFMQSERAMRSFSAGPALASMLWAFATLRQAPPKGWMEHYLWQVCEEEQPDGLHCMLRTCLESSFHYQASMFTDLACTPFCLCRFSGVARRVTLTLCQ